jgi:hypothetical protein
MKTQIITLAAHDDLVSIRDRMLWAKAPRILLVWPVSEQVALQPLDLRILQQHAWELGAELGLVTRGDRIRRDAHAFQIPVFRSTIEAQRRPWASRNRRGRRRLAPLRERLNRLRAMQTRARPTGAAWRSASAARLVSFLLAVSAVIAIAGLFVPRAVIVLTPETQQQSLTLTLDVRTGNGAGILQGGVPAQWATILLNGTKTMPVLTRSEVPSTRAGGVARIQNLSVAPLLIPAGTVVYTLKPDLRRYITLQDAQLDAGANTFVDVPIEAVNAGSDGNLPPDSLEGAEGSLSASIRVSNLEPIAGGSNEEQSVPSEEDRDRLQIELNQMLQAEARAAIEAMLEDGDMLIPGTISMSSLEGEVFDPPAGQAASVLSLTIDAIYEAQYVRGSDLRALSLLALDAQMPSGYVPRDGTLRMQINEFSAAGSGQAMQLQLDLERTLSRRIDVMRADQVVRGAPPAEASARLEQALPLAEAPEIRLTPAWWPWMPLIPFRTELVMQ